MEQISLLFTLRAVICRLIERGLCSAVHLVRLHTSPLSLLGI
jgi:hypothetical protein